MAEDKDKKTADQGGQDHDDDVVNGDPDRPVASDEEQQSSEEQAHVAAPQSWEVLEEDQPADAELTPAPKARGRGIAWFAVLLALVALGGVGYLYYLSLGVETPAPEGLAAVANELAEVSAARERDARSLSDSLAEATTRMERELASQRASLKASEQALAESISESLKQEPPTSREWKVAEAQYLMRIANHRLLMERDVRGAAMLLAAADDILAGLDDFSLFPVRSALAEELAALGTVTPLDVQGVFLRLEAIKTRLNELPLRLPQFVAARRGGASDAAESPGFWQKLVARVMGLFEFRHYDDKGITPLLTPSEATYLEMNLRLMFERAQLALLRADAVLFEISLDAAREWVDLYLAGDNPAVIDVAAELDELTGLKLDRPLPDISASLAALKSVSRSPDNEPGADS